MKYNNFALLIGLLFSTITSLHGQSPNIILITVDGLGFNDVGFHGNSEIPTPNIDALAYSGVILNKYYIYPSAKESLIALITGKYPTRLGPRRHDSEFMPSNERFLAEYLENLGYTNYMVGKWHLSENMKKGYKPLNISDYKIEQTYPINKYSVIALSLILMHNKKTPLFLHTICDMKHTGNNYAADDLEKFNYIEYPLRQKHAIILSKLDEFVGELLEVLNANSMTNSMIIFTSTNGQTAMNSLSNYPFKGGRNTHFEGGIRGTAFIWSPFITKSSRIGNQNMHIVDWLPTILDISFGKPESRKSLDGINIWTPLNLDVYSYRLETHVVNGFGSAYIMEPWKLVQNSEDEPSNQWNVPYTAAPSYDYNLVLDSIANKVLTEIDYSSSRTVMENLRKSATIDCKNGTNATTKYKCTDHPCLFNIVADPCESQNLIDNYPDIVRKLRPRMDFLKYTFSEAGKFTYPPSLIHTKPDTSSKKFWYSPVLDTINYIRNLRFFYFNVFLWIITIFIKALHYKL